MEERVVSSFCNPSSSGPNTVSCWPTPTNLYTAVANGKHVLVTCVEKHTVVQLLTPAAKEPITCVAFSRTGQIAAASVSAVTIYTLADVDDPTNGWLEVATFTPSSSPTCLTWAEPTPDQPTPKLWVAGLTLALWKPTSDGWESLWSHSLAQPARHLAASLHGSLVATAGEDDLSVKVWYPLDRSRTPDSESQWRPRAASGVRYGFCYLRHPCAVASVAFRPPERNAKGDALNEAADASILLTSCVNGVPRLWRMAQAPEPQPRCVFLCATLTTSANGGAEDRARPSSRTLLVRWLEPTSRSSCPTSSPSATVGELDADVALSPRPRPPASPLLRPGLGVPTLRPSLRERHDYVVSLLADGTLIVWLVLGLSAVPRCSPKLMVWATLPKILPPLERVLSAAAFCNFESRPTPDLGAATGAELLVPQRADDQLPSAISMLLHTSDAICPLRLCSVNVERGAAGERVQQQLLVGHGEHDVVDLAANPECSLSASVDREGALLVWEAESFAHRRIRSAASSARIRSVGAEGDDFELCEAPTTLELANSAPSFLLRLPGKFDLFVWLPRASDDDRARLVAFGSDGARLYARGSHGAWSRSAAVGDSASFDGSDPARWVSAGVLQPPVRRSSGGGESIGFAMRGGETSRLLLWRCLSADRLQVVGEAPLNRAACRVVTCVASISSRGASLPLSRRANATHLGSVLCGYADGVVARWELGVSHAPHGDILHAAMVQEVLKPPSGGASWIPYAISAGGARAGILYRQEEPNPEGRLACELRIIEHETCHPEMQEELLCSIKARHKPTCAFIAVSNDVNALAVSSDQAVVLYAQTWARSQASEGKRGSTQWTLIGRWSIPGDLKCTSTAWSSSGTLIVGAGPFLISWPHLLRTQADALQRRDLSQWHPTNLLQQFLADPARSCRVLDHLNSQSSLLEAAPVPLAELLNGPESAKAAGTPGGQAASSPFLDKASEDMFAPQATSHASVDDLFAPTTVKRDLFAELDGPFASKVDATQTNAVKVGPAATLLRAVENEGQAPLSSLGEREHASLVQLLKAQKAVDTAGAAIDACGARFVLYALTCRNADGSFGAVPAAAVAWATLSDCQPTLLDLCNTERGNDVNWASLRALGVGFWLPQGDALNKVLETAAKAHFTKRKEPEDCALLYIALGKKKQLQALCKAVRDERMHSFLSNDFTEERWRSAAMKNAYSLLSKQRFELAIAFFLLAEELGSALRVCTRQLRDLQLALVLCRLFHRLSPDALKTTVREDLLPEAAAAADDWMSCVGYLLLGEPQQALRIVSESRAPEAADASSTAASTKSGLRVGAFEPSAAAFCVYLSSLPRYRLPPQPIAPELQSRCAYAFVRMGALVLAIEAFVGGRFDKRAPVAMDSDAVPAHLVGSAICMLLSDRAAQIARSSTGDGTPRPPFIRQSMAQLREEARLLCEHARVSIEAVQRHAEEDATRVPLSAAILPRLLTLGALERWTSCRALLESASQDLLSLLSSCLPHELTTTSCTLLSKAMPVLVAGVASLDQEATVDTEALQGRVALLARRATYAVCCSGREFGQLLRWLPQDQSESAVDPCATIIDLYAGGKYQAAPPVLTDEERYVWARFHLCFLHHEYHAAEQHDVPPVAIEPDPSKEGGVRPPPLLQVRRAADHSAEEDTLILRWLVLSREESRQTVARLPPATFPLDPTATLSKGSPEMAAAVSKAWNVMLPDSTFEEETGDHLGGEDSIAQQGQPPEPIDIWPLEGEAVACLDAEPKVSSSSSSSEPSLSAAIELFNRRGDFVRAVCVNALNSSQLALCLSRGVHQLELSGTPSSMASRDADAAAPISTGGDADAKDVLSGSGIQVQESVASDFNARCLCAHPKLPLYLAGGDSVVQCWQFGQSIQGQGLNDHLRAQYKLPAGGHVANIQISPDCEWFSSLDQAGYLSLWRFQSGSDMPLPFSRLQCHSKRGADLCFVDSSVVLATVGLSHGADAAPSLCLWDVLLPPDKALVASSAAHTEGGRCLSYCASDMSLVSGGEKGEMAIFDLRQRRIREKWSAHTFAVQALARAGDKTYFSASADASIKLWSMDAPCAALTEDDSPTDLAEGQPRARWAQAHDSNMLSPLVGSKLGQTGVTALTLMPAGGGAAHHGERHGATSGYATGAAGLVSGGADGKVKMWRFG